MKRALLLFGTLVIAIIFGTLYRAHLSPVQAHGDHDDDWQSGPCIQTECGKADGLKTETRTVTACTYSCPVINFSWKVYQDCPNGYRPKGEDKCEKTSHPNKGQIINRPYSLQTADVVYDKSQDPHKCHRPSDADLTNIYGMSHDARLAFKQQYSEWMNAVKECQSKQETRTVACTVHHVVPCDTTPSPTPCEPSPTPTPGEPTPTPTEDPGEPTPTPTEDPGEPTATPTQPQEPSATPAPSQSQGSTSALGYNLNCANSDIEVTYDVKKADGTTDKDVKVTFTYNGSTLEAKTNDNGRASVLFGKNGDGTVKATADGYADQSAYMEMPKDCPVTAPAVGGTTGQVLGASTEVSYANTGSATSQIFTAAQLLGMLMITAGAARYAYETIKS